MSYSPIIQKAKCKNEKLGTGDIVNDAISTANARDEGKNWLDKDRQPAAIEYLTYDSNEGKYISFKPKNPNINANQEYKITYATIAIESFNDREYGQTKSDVNISRNHDILSNEPMQNSLDHHHFQRELHIQDSGKKRIQVTNARPDQMRMTARRSHYQRKTNRERSKTKKKKKYMRNHRKNLNKEKLDEERKNKPKNKVVVNYEDFEKNIELGKINQHNKSNKKHRNEDQIIRIGAISGYIIDPNFEAMTTRKREYQYSQTKKITKVEIDLRQEHDKDKHQFSKEFKVTESNEKEINQLDKSAVQQFRGKVKQRVQDQQHVNDESGHKTSSRHKKRKKAEIDLKQEHDKDIDRFSKEFKVTDIEKEINQFDKNAVKQFRGKEKQRFQDQQHVNKESGRETSSRHKKRKRKLKEVNYLKMDLKQETDKNINQFSKEFKLSDKDKETNQLHKSAVPKFQGKEKKLVQDQQHVNKDSSREKSSRYNKKKRKLKGVPYLKMDLKQEQDKNIHQFPKEFKLSDKDKETNQLNKSAVQKFQGKEKQLVQDQQHVNKESSRHKKIKIERNKKKGPYSEIEKVINYNKHFDKFDDNDQTKMKQYISQKQDRSKDPQGNNYDEGDREHGQRGNSSSEGTFGTPPASQSNTRSRDQFLTHDLYKSNVTTNDHTEFQGSNKRQPIQLSSINLRSKKKVLLENQAMETFAPYSIANQLSQIKEELIENAEIKQEIIGRTAEYNDIVLWKIRERGDAYKNRVKSLSANKKFVDEAPEKKIIFIVHGLSVMGWHLLPCLSNVKHFRTLLGYYLENLDSFDIYLIPMANPDGVSRTLVRPIWDKNFSPQSKCPGVNLNRNFDIAWNYSVAKNMTSCTDHYPGAQPFSEPESKAVRDVFVKYGHKIVGFFHVHAGTYQTSVFKGDAILYPKGYTSDEDNDDKYVDLKGEIDEAMRSTDFKTLSVTVDTLNSWYGNVFGLSVDYADMIFRIPYSLELVMQLYKEDLNFECSVERERYIVLTELWQLLIDNIFDTIYKHEIQPNE